MGKTLREKIESLPVDRQAKIEMMADEFMAEEMTLRALREAGHLTQVQLAQRLNIGGEIAYLDLPLVQSKNPWLEIAGKYQDDPNWEEYQTAITSARQAANEIEGIWLEEDALI